MRALVALAALPIASCVHHFKKLNSIQDLELLGVMAKDDGIARKHMLLGFGDKECVNELRDLGFPSDYGSLGEDFETGEIMFDRHEDLATHFNISTCRQFVYIPRGGKIEDAEILDAQDKLQLNNWFYEHLRLEVEVDNDLPFDVEIRWEDTSKREGPKNLVTIPANEVANINTFESHHLRFYRKDERSEVPLLRIRMDGSPTLVLSDYVHDDSTEQCSNPDECTPPANDRMQLDQEDMETWKYRDWENRARILRNEEQPQTKPRYTPLGFKKARVPDDIFKIMWDRYKTGERITEPWPKSDCHTNFFEAPSTMIYLTDQEKDRIFAGVNPMLSEWAGNANLIPTSCYGVRMYHNGSWLREHVDTGDTHIISAIMQIDQDVKEDWHLTLVDHNGDRHFITMEPQDMVYYESASCLHGRPVAFNGNFYANTFIHFKVAK